MTQSPYSRSILLLATCWGLPVAVTLHSPTQKSNARCATLAHALGAGAAGGTGGVWGGAWLAATAATAIIHPVIIFPASPHANAAPYPFLHRFARYALRP